MAASLPNVHPAYRVGATLLSTPGADPLAAPPPLSALNLPTLVKHPIFAAVAPPLPGPARPPAAGSRPPAPSAAPAPAPASTSTQTPAQQAGSGLTQLITGGGGGFGGGNAITNAIANQAEGGNFNPLDLAASGAAAGTVALAQDVVGVAGQAVLGVLTTIGHGLANALVVFLQWAGGLAKTYVVALAVAGIVLLVLFR